jgi:glycosyltransferase involved in cell wall biosynthesis
MRCLHVITGLGTGGAEMMLRKLVERTEGASLLNEVVSLTTVGPVGRQLEAQHVRVTALNMRPTAPSPFAIGRLVSLVRHARADVVQTWMYHANVLGSLAAAFGGRAPVVWNVRASTMEAGAEKWTTRALARASGYLAHRACAAVVTNSAVAREVHRAMGFPDAHFRVIPNGFDTARFRPDADARRALRAELGLSSSAPLVGIVGRWHPAKGFATFLEAAGQLAAERTDVRFLLVGDGVTGENAELAALVARNGLASRVHCLGPRTDTPAVFAALDLYASASIYEAFPNVLGEAMASAVPCVATHVGDSALVLGDTGRVVPARDAVAMAAAWRELLSLDPAERAALGARARRRIEEHYHIDAVAEQYVELYRGIIDVRQR